MGDKFCFSAELQECMKFSVFKSEIGEDYYVSYKANNFGEIALCVEWITPKQNLLKVELFTADFTLISSQMQIGCENQTNFKFIVHNTPGCVDSKCNLIVIITAIPYVDMKDVSVAPKDQEEISANDDEQIQEISEDLLIGLAMDMRDLLTNSDISDAVLTNGKHVVKVHAAILSARSPVFSKAFTDSSYVRVFTIPDASAGALEDIAAFIYSSFIRIKNMDRAEELYVLANEYEIPDLCEVCSVYMSNCTIDSVLKSLILADKYEDDRLRKSSINFILRNLGEVKCSEKWPSFAEENVDLVSEIFRSVSSALEEDALHSFISRLSAKKMKK